MSTSSIITQRPAISTAAASVVAALAFGSAAVVVSHHTTHPLPSFHGAQASHGSPRNAHFGSPTTGGHVQMTP
jgi:hypothetical protein